MVIETAGGGGYGPSGARDSQALDQDLRDGKVSEAAARDSYGT